MKIFISYSSKDEQKVKAIKRLMPKSEVHIWIDHLKLKGGSILGNSIKKGIDNADIYFLFVSQNSIDSDWVKKEINWAIKREEKLKYEFIVPIVLDYEAWNKCKNKKIKEKLFIDYNHKDSFELANEIKDTIISKIIAKYETMCLTKKEIVSNILAGVAMAIGAIAFFTTPPKQKIIESLQNESELCHSHNINVTDYTFLETATCPIDNKRELFSVGIFGMIFTKEQDIK